MKIQVSSHLQIPLYIWPKIGEVAESFMKEDRPLGYAGLIVYGIQEASTGKIIASLSVYKTKTRVNVEYSDPIQLVSPI